jgi:hypothetical protein
MGVLAVLAGAFVPVHDAVTGALHYSFIMQAFLNTAGGSPIDVRVLTLEGILLIMLSEYLKRFERKVATEDELILARIGREPVGVGAAPDDKTDRGTP